MSRNITKRIAKHYSITDLLCTIKACIYNSSKLAAASDCIDIFAISFRQNENREENAKHTNSSKEPKATVQANDLSK